MVASLGQLSTGLWSKLPGYESDDDEDSECEELSDGEELARLVDERLPDVRAALGDRWVDQELVHFCPPEQPGPDSQAATPVPLQAPPLRCPSVPLWRSFNPSPWQPMLRPGGPTFRINGIDAPVLRQTLLSNGLAATKDRDVVVLWNGSRVAENVYRLLASFQKVNHFPGSTELTQKDRMFCHLKAMSKRFGKSAFNFVPETYVLPDQLDEFLNAYQRTEYVWIVKPNAMSCGRGIFMLKNIDEIPLEGTTVVSRYIDKPLLIQGLKFDLRIYVLVTSYEPLRAYVYREGLVRFASKAYSCEGKHIHDVYRHLTNYSVNKNAPGFTENKEVEADNVGHKWSFSALNRHLGHVGLDHDLMWTRIMDLLVKSLVSVQPVVVGRQRELNMRHPSCFEIYGFDVLVDEALKPWLLEVNLSPSMRAESPLDWSIKSSLLSDSFNLVGVVSDPAAVPPPPASQSLGGYGLIPRVNSMPLLSSTGGLAAQLARAEAPDTKHGIAKEAVALDTLSEAQLKMLSFGLEESRRCQNFCRLYPTRKAVHRYAPLIERKVKGLREDFPPDGVRLSASQLLASVLFGPRPVQTRPPPPPLEQAKEGHPRLQSRPRSEGRPRRAASEDIDASATPTSEPSGDVEVTWPSVPSPAASSLSTGLEPRPRLPEEGRPHGLGLLRPKFPDGHCGLPRPRHRVAMKSGLPPMPSLLPKVPPPLTGLAFRPSDLGRLPPSCLAAAPAGAATVAPAAAELRRERSGAVVRQRSSRRRVSESRGHDSGDGEVAGEPEAPALTPLRVQSPCARPPPFVFTSPSLHSEMRNIEL